MTDVLYSFLYTFSSQSFELPYDLLRAHSGSTWNLGLSSEQKDWTLKSPSQKGRGEGGLAGRSLLYEPGFELAISLDPIKYLPTLKYNCRELGATPSLKLALLE